MPPYAPPTPAVRDRAPEQGLLTRPQCELCHLPVPATENGREGVNSSALHAVIMTSPGVTLSGPGDCDRARPPDKLSPSAGVPLPGQNLLRGGCTEHVRTDKRLDDHRAPTEARRLSRLTKDRTGGRRPFAQKKPLKGNCHHSRPTVRGPPTDKGKKSTTSIKQRTLAVELCK